MTIFQVFFEFSARFQLFFRLFLSFVDPPVDGGGDRKSMLLLQYRAQTPGLMHPCGLQLQLVILAEVMNSYSTGLALFELTISLPVVSRETPPVKL